MPIESKEEFTKQSGLLDRLKKYANMLISWILGECIGSFYE